jgi:hypothetical protein
MKFKPGDNVVVVGEIPRIITMISGLQSGQIGVVTKECSCLRGEEIRETFTAKFIGKLEAGDLHRVAFDYGKVCVPAVHLRKLADDQDDDKMVDWSKVPKPWEIGVTDDPRTKK